MGGPSELVLSHEQVFFALPSARMRAEELVPEPYQTNARRSRPLHSQTVVLVCGPGSKHQSQERRPRCHSAEEQITIHPAGENAFRIGDRDTLRRNQG